MKMMDLCERVCFMMAIFLFITPFAMTNRKVTRHNGTDWIHFGAGIINSCKMIRVSLFIEGQEIDKNIVDSKKLGKLKKWITDNFREKLNFSPVHPKYESLEHQNFLILYSGDIDDDEDMLIMIPFNDKTVCPRLKEYIQKLKELKTIVEEKP